MILLPKNSDWYRNFFLDKNELDIYKNDAGQYNFTATLAAKVLLPLILQHYRYDPTSSVWYRFDGLKFSPSEQLFTDLTDSLNDLKLRCEPAKQYFTGLNRVHNDRFVPTVKEILQKIYITHIDIDKFDSDPRLINTPDGVFDLLTGESWPNAAEYLCRQITLTAPEDDQDGTLCPNYMKHLNFMCSGDKTLINWLEEVSGYILTGYTFEQEFYWFFGLANNGKSTLIKIWQHIMGDYSWSATNDMFALNYYHVHNEQMMRLAGKRLIVTEELKGNRWDEAKIKGVVSGETIAAAEKFGKTNNFTPICKLIFTSNHKPMVDANDGGMARRMNLMPFMNQITPDMRIRDFENKYLRPEGPYILNRMIKAAQRVLQKQKIEKPTFVALATQQYFSANNVIQQIIEDAFNVNPNFSASNKQIGAIVKLWCDENNHEQLTMRIVGQKLEQLGFESFNANGSRGRRGLQVNEAYSKKIKFV